jgi:hypothetical protein
MKYFYFITLVLFCVWNVATISICEKKASRERCDSARSFYRMFAEYAPRSWKRASAVVLGIWIAAFVGVGFFVHWEW